MIERRRAWYWIVAMGGVVLLLAAGGCASAGREEAGAEVSAVAVTEAAASATVTREVAPSATPEPPVSGTASATARVTPTAALEIAPYFYYLAYAQDTLSGSRLVLADAGPNSRTDFTVPGVPWKGTLDLEGLSEGGEYFAYRTGDISERQTDLTLRIVRLADREEIFSVPLVTHDVNEQLLALGEQLAKSPPAGLRDATQGELTAEVIAAQGWVAMETGLGAMEWSPDGRLLAFAAQIDGPSSDVYTYDVVDGQLRRLTDGPSQVQYVDWSPNARWIAYGSAYYIDAAGVGIGNYMINNFVSRDGASVVTARGGGGYCHEWLWSGWYAVCGATEENGKYRLQVIRPDDDSVRTLWEGPFASYAVSMSEQILVVHQAPMGDLGPEAAGTYIVDLERETRERLAEHVIWVERSRKDGDLAVVMTEEGALAVGLDGEVRFLWEGESGRAYQPLTGWRTAFVGQDDPRGVRVLDVTSGEKVELDVPSAWCVSWRPDEFALVFMVGDSVYFNDLQGNASVLVDQGVHGVQGVQESGLITRQCNVVWFMGPSVASGEG